jgi:hypothetical protein
MNPYTKARKATYVYRHRWETKVVKHRAYIFLDLIEMPRNPPQPTTTLVTQLEVAGKVEGMNIPTLSVEVKRKCIKKIMQQVQQLASSAVTPEPTKQLVLDNDVKKALKGLEDVSIILHCNNFN